MVTFEFGKLVAQVVAECEAGDQVDHFFRVIPGSGSDVAPGVNVGIALEHLVLEEQGIVAI